MLGLTSVGLLYIVSNSHLCPQLLKKTDAAIIGSKQPKPFFLWHLKFSETQYSQVNGRMGSSELSILEKTIQDS